MKNTKCQCGCGQNVKEGKLYILGHNSKSTAKTESNTDGNHRWKAGQSGNPRGRPQGSRNKASLAVENLFLSEKEALSEKCIELALAGNLPALKIAVDRICPPRKDTPIKVKLPRVDTIEDACQLTAALLDMVATGELTPTQGELLSRMVEKHTKNLQLNDLEARLLQLEEKLDAA